ncbi:MAG: hypothetical protein DLM68_13945 [Hyphomicrobiales bacterium]|nr:MAG: hypothetical protein DLM68_13945 [Hyphomicrobiales bacterium]
MKRSWVKGFGNSFFGAPFLIRFWRNRQPGPPLRILAIAMGLDGHSRLLAADARGIGGAAPRGSVHRDDDAADRMAGPADRPRPGRPAALTDGQRTNRGAIAIWVGIEFGGVKASFFARSERRGEEVCLLLPGQRRDQRPPPQ